MEQKYELYHHGILGMHWGIRRFQNKDGSLTDAGLKRYYGQGKKSERFRQEIDNNTVKTEKNIYGGKISELESQKNWLKSSYDLNKLAAEERKKYLEKWYKKHSGEDWLTDGSKKGLLTYLAASGASKGYEDRLIYINNEMLGEKYGTKRFFENTIKGARWIGNLDYIAKSIDPNDDTYGLSAKFAMARSVKRKRK